MPFVIGQVLKRPRPSREVDRIGHVLAPATGGLLTATVEGELVGWLNVRRAPEIARWLPTLRPASVDARDEILMILDPI